MRRVTTVFAWVLVLTAFVSLGCRSGPTTPETQAPPELSAASDHTGAQSHGCLGFYSLVIDAENHQVEVLPLRSGEWHFNLTGVLNTTMGVSAAMVPGESDPANGLFVLDITLTHPFGAKPQFSGFDVKGVLVTPGTLTLGPLVLADVDETRLENADGYTRWWNPTEFTSPGMLGYTEGILAIGPASALTATVNPYKLFADILYPESSLAVVCDEPLDSDYGRAVFRPGSSNTRRYRIRFEMDPGPQVIYGYAIDCAWNPPSPSPPTEIPDDFPIEANQPEAYRLGVVPTANSLYYDSEAGVGGGVLRLQINVHDWQGQDAGDIRSEISAVRIFAPDLMTGGVDGVFLNETPIKARYTADLTGLAEPAGAGEALIICRVGSSDGSQYKQGPQPAPEESLSAYQVIMLDIPDPECTADANNDWSEAVEVGFGEPVTDQVCVPDDTTDYYLFDLPPGFEPQGEIRLYCDAGPTQLALLDFNHDMINSAPVSGGVAVVPIPDGLVPGTYFIRVMTWCDTQVGVYLLEVAADLVDVTPSSPIDVTPSTLYCFPDKVWLHGNYAFLFRRGYWVYDISDPGNPVQIAYEESRDGHEACFSYPYCYYLSWEGGDYGLNLIDFSDPTSPSHHEDLLTGTSLISICMNSTHVYVGNNFSPVSQVKILEYGSDPLHPTEVGSVGTDPYPSRMALLDPEGPDTHLVVRIDTDIVSFDVEDPSGVTPAGTYAFASGWPLNITTFDDYVLVSHQETGMDGWLYVLKQTTFPSLVQHGKLDIPSAANCITYESGYAYISGANDGFTVCDVSTPDTPTHVGTFPLVLDAQELDVLGNTLCIIPYKAGLHIFDVSDVHSPVLEHRLRVVNMPREGQASGEYLFVADSPGQYPALKVIDISNPADAEIVATWETPKMVNKLWLDGDRLVIAGSDEWHLMDISDPLSPSAHYTGGAGSTIQAVGMLGDALYVAEDSKLVSVYNISTPSSPAFETSFSAASYGQDFSFYADHMYLSLWNQVEIYSITDPLSPAYLGSYPLTDLHETVVSWDHLYMVTEIGELVVADLVDPSAPAYTGSVDGFAAGILTNLVMSGQVAYVGGETVPYACWAWPPDNPSYIGEVYSPPEYGLVDLVLHNGYLYEVSPNWGLRIHELY